MEGMSTGSGSSKSCSSSRPQALQQQQAVAAAPFVAKMYEMVSDRRNDALIRWGPGNNSFIVQDPHSFSQLLIPNHFNHSNFSSFVRQLNTYGFRKVDTERWEFAHESFLRGQTHLLPLIARRRKKMEDDRDCGDDNEEETVLLREVGRLRDEHKAMEEELAAMSKRLLATERRPQQMLSFLEKVAHDPEFLPRFIFNKKQQQQQQLNLEGGDKKRRLLQLPSSCRPALCNVDLAATTALVHDRMLKHCNGGVADDHYVHAATGSNPEIAADSDSIRFGSGLLFLTDFGSAEDSPVMYPFSLLG